MSTLADLRQEYARAELTTDHVSEDPIEQFRDWFNDARDAELPDANAMTLATATADASPSARIVLLKGLDERGFIFYTNYESRKGAELDQNPQAALVFFWTPLERQVRVEGSVERLPEEESAEYFRRRPRGSKLGAWASPQSQVVESREALQQRLEEVLTSYEEDDSVPCPPDWGGYIVRPHRIEFWQGRPNRLHDRLCYHRDDADDDWSLKRLAP